MDKRGIPQGSAVFDPPLLYRIDEDPSEKTDVAGQQPEVVQRLRLAAEEFAASVDPKLQLRPYGRAILRGLLTPAP